MLRLRKKFYGTEAEEWEEEDEVKEWKSYFSFVIKYFSVNNFFN